ncbi:MAG: GNAT family N-acetyltransferase, partial [Flavobacteriales bacterium]|nr:GNAT family N-acetyltransferase [Flavobacteriales bacterium]
MHNEVTIRPGTSTDIPAIRNVALVCWPIAYHEIISGEQISYMLDLMYSEESLRRQIEQDGHRFFLAMANGQCVGYASIGRMGIDRSKLHKLYVLPETKGTGVGGLLIRHVIQ